MQLKIRESGQIHDVVRAKQARRTSSQLVPNQISNPLFPRTQKSTFTLLKTSDERVPGQVKRAKNRTERAKPVPQSHKIEQIEISSTLKSEMVAVAQLGRRRSQFIFDFFKEHRNQSTELSARFWSSFNILSSSSPQPHFEKRRA